MFVTHSSLKILKQTKENSEIKIKIQNGNHNKSKIKAYTTAFTVREAYNGNEIENLIKSKKNMNPNLQKATEKKVIRWKIPRDRAVERREGNTHNRRTKHEAFTRPEKFPNPILIFWKADWLMLSRVYIL